jgi:hypothetical protein
MLLVEAHREITGVMAEKTLVEGEKSQGKRYAYFGRG